MTTTLPRSDDLAKDLTAERWLFRGSLVVALGVLGWQGLGWETESKIFWEDELPMAPSVWGLALGLIVAMACVAGVKFRWIGRVLLAFVAVASLTLMVQNWTGSGESFERGLWPQFIAKTAHDGARGGFMAPFTAGALAALASAFLASSFRYVERQVWARMGLAIAMAMVVFYSALLFIAHAIDTPLFHNWTYASVTESDLILLIALGLAGLAKTRGFRFVGQSDLAEQLSVETQLSLKRDRQFLVAMVTLLFCAIAFGSFSWLRHEHRDENERLREQLMLVVQNKVSDVGQWLDERMADAFQVSRSPLVADAILDDALAQARALKWLQEVVVAYQYASASLFDAKGNLVLATSPDELVDPAVRKQLLDAAAQTDQVVLGNMHRPGDGPVRLESAAAVRASDGSVRGVVVLRINPELKLYPMLLAWPLAEFSGEVLMVRRDGALIRYLSPVSGQMEKALRFTQSMDDPRLIAARVLRGETGYLEGSSYSGRASVAAALPVHGTDWIIGVRADSTEVHAKLESDLVLVAFGLTGSFFMLNLGGALYWRRRVHTFWTQQAASEREHRRTSERLSHVLRAAGEAMLLVDSQSRIVEANDCALRLYATTREEMIGSDPRRFCEQCLERRSGQARELIVLPNRRHDGSSFLGEVVIETVNVDGDELHLVIVRDVTEREAQSERLRRLSRISAAVGAVNESLARLREIEPMLVAASRALVEHAGFKLVWIGRHEIDRGVIVRAAAAGDVTPFFENLEVPATDVPSNTVSIQRAFLSGKPCIIADFQADPELTPWVATTTAAGVRSAATFPLRVNGRTWGVLAAYADVPISLRTDELTLLEKVAADISFALGMIENDQMLKLLGAAINAANTTVMITDASGRITWVNRSFTDITGYTLNEAVGRNPRMLKSGHQGPEFYAEMWQALSNGQSWRGRFVNRRKDGTFFTEDSAIAPVFSPEGVISHYVAVKIDITAQLRAEKEAGDERKRLKTLLEITTESVAFADPETGAFVDFNQRAHESLGYTREEFARMKILDIDVGLSPDEIRTTVALMMRPEGYAIDTRHRCKNGEIRDVRLGSRPIDFMGRRLLSSTWIDVTEARERERQLLASNARLEQAQRVASLGSWETDMTTRLSRWSDQCFRIAGIKPEPEVSLARFFDFVHPDDRERIRDEYWRSVREQRACACDYRLVTAQGEVRQVQLRGEHSFAADGRLARSFGTLQDVTEKKQLQDELLRAQRLESIGMLSAGIAHDLNNVLAPILMAAPILRMRAPNSSEMERSLLRTLEKSAERGAGLVKQILSFAHGISGNVQLVQVKHILRDVASVARETFPKSIQVSEEVPSELLPIQGHPSQIHQVVLNLVVNARDAMPDGGVLTVRGENVVLDQAAAATLKGASAGEWLVLHVEDTGTGIPPEVLERMWEAFFTTKAPGRGTGLGLATVRRIVEDHRGFIEVRTAVGRGTAFRIYLPVDRSAESKGTAEEAPVFFGDQELILIVDDEETIREMTKLVLIDHNYRVLTARDGAEAVALYTQHAKEVAIVITDLDMPNLDGGGLSRVLRHLNPAVRIIAISGLEGSSATTKVRPEEFAVAFLPKPFRQETLLNLVHHALKKS